MVRTYSRDYAAEYHRRMNGMVEKRMRQAILSVGSYWYTSWRLAGSPDLGDLIEQNIEAKPPTYKKRLKIKDREAFDVGFLMNGCCGKPTPKAQAFGLHRTLSCVQDDPRWPLVVEEIQKAEPSSPKKPWYKRLWNWLTKW